MTELLTPRAGSNAKPKNDGLRCHATGNCPDMNNGIDVYDPHQRKTVWLCHSHYDQYKQKIDVFAPTTQQQTIMENSQNHTHEESTLDDKLEQLTAAAKINTQSGDKSKTHNDVLDNPETLKNVDLLSFVDDDHLLKKLSIDIANVLHLPESTVFLLGLATFSSIACRKYATQYPDGTKLPIGLYAIAEQPPGTGKSRCLNIFQKPFYKIHKAVENERKEEIKTLELNQKINDDLTEDEKKRLHELIGNPTPDVLVTNATAAGLEVVLIQNKGFFTAASAEQGMFNTLFSVKANGGTVNNDSVLEGFAGGFTSVSRSGRESYSGSVVGSVISFAQKGSVEAVLEAGGSTGLAERFLMLVEPDKLGTRDHTKKGKVSEKLLFDYEMACNCAQEAFTNPLEYQDLYCLFISQKGFDLIAQYQNAIESHLANGGKYSFSALQGSVAKIDIQIMKIAANLHLLSEDFRMKLTPIISDKCVESAIKIANRLLQHLRKMLIEKGIIGLKAEYQVILKLFEFKDAKLTRRMIFERVRGVKPFVDMPEKAAALDSCLEGMIKQDLLINFEELNEKGKKPLQVYQLGQ